MSSIKIKNRETGENFPVFIIAEACDNHLGNLEKAMEMALQSKLPGADAVKYQHHLPVGAISLGAKIIEKHIILDKKQPGPDQSVSIDLFELKQLVDGIRKIELAMGSDKKINELEKPIRVWAHRSIVTLSDILKGTILTEELIWTKRPGTGIPAKKLEAFIGKKPNKDLKKDVLLNWSEID